MSSPSAGRVVAITGAASGIGRALAERLVRRGDHVILLDVDAAGLDVAAQAMAERAAASGGSVGAEVVDVRDAGRVAQVVGDIWERFGRIDIMVNNAGVAVGGPAEDLGVEHWQRAFDVNLSGVMHGVVAVYPRMVAARSGQIVNVASLAGLIPAPMMAAYSASEHGVVGLSLSLAGEAESYGIAVTCVCPGFTETPLLDRAGPDDLRPTMAPGDARLIPKLTHTHIYDVDKMAADIEHGIDHRAVLVVAPASARMSWAVSRVSPRAILTMWRGVVAQLRDTHERMVGETQQQESEPMELAS
ncbi:MAG: SDR family oxidoreductase [Actinobacteria bacterium]|nr:MAG: SDR family oxidoreductase [Actinomycetota bacterium]